MKAMAGSLFGKKKKDKSPGPASRAGLDSEDFEGGFGSLDPDLDEGPNDIESLKRYCKRLSQVVMQQHTARREDWAHFHARENQLLEEVGELRRFAEDRDSLRWYEAKIMEELRLERRKRIDLEARLTGADRWRTEAIAAGRMARNAEVTMSFGQEAELAEAREWQRNAERFRAAEERAVASERFAEDSLKRSRQELGRSMRDLEKRAAEVELRAEASEAQTLSEGWRLAGELKGELDAMKGAAAQGYRGGGPKAPALESVPVSPVTGRVTSARRALEDIRGVRDRLDGVLSSMPG